jgi:D-hexose-6-phosphate mutarotase
MQVNKIQTPVQQQTTLKADTIEQSGWIVYTRDNTVRKWYKCNNPDNWLHDGLWKNAVQWREYHGKVAWLYNPWTKVQRDARDIGDDTFGYLIADSSTDVRVNINVDYDPFVLRELQGELRKHYYK